jgi:hypothetical protein
VIVKCHASLNLPPALGFSCASAASSCLSPSERPRVATIILK